MNIKITYNWLLEYLETDADPYEIQKYLSLCGPSVERVDKVGDDFVLDIEITSNRVDSASVFGIAQECSAILPAFGKKATLNENPLEMYTFKDIYGNSPRMDSMADIRILGDDLVSRVSAIILSDIQIGESTKFIKDRLIMCNIKSINNVVDISNYLMIALGQPNHTFDYDKVKDHKLYIRESKKGEKVKTLDEKEIVLPGGDIVIEDGTGNLTDLAGIMGGYDSMVTKNTKNVLLLLETYNPTRIRKTSMTTGQRTVAAMYFEKGLDPTRIEPALVYGVQLLKQYAGGQVASDIIDIYPRPIQAKKLTVSVKKIQSLIGADIPVQKMSEILANLGFETLLHDDSMTITIPSFRAQDIDSWQDIAEEVARIHGYFNINGVVQQTRSQTIDSDRNQKFVIENKAKYYLKHVGVHEIYNYSMISRKMIESFGYNPRDFLKLNNTISENIEYLRKLLVPSLVGNIKQNEGKRERLTFFEIANTYHSRTGELPDEQRHLAIATNQSYLALKGILEGLFAELNINEYSFEVESESTLFNKNCVAKIKVGTEYNGHIGRVRGHDGIYAVEMDFSRLLEHVSPIAHYIPASHFATVKLDLTYSSDPEHTFEKLRETAFSTSKLIQRLTLVTIYGNKVTVQFEFGSKERNITEEEAKYELARIKNLQGS